MGYKRPKAVTSTDVSVTQAKLTLIDRIMHRIAFSKPKSKLKLNKKISVILIDDEKYLCSLKFSYAGNTQFHPLTRDEVQNLISVLSELESEK